MTLKIFEYILFNLRRKLNQPNHFIVFSTGSRPIIIQALALLFMLMSCNPAKPVVPGFNAKIWEDGRNGCQPTRKDQIKIINDNKELLLAQPESGIISVLGKPDLIELYKRNQKMFLYFLTPSSGCGDTRTTPETLTIRFNAMGRAKEIYTSELNATQP